MSSEFPVKQMMHFDKNDRCRRRVGCEKWRRLGTAAADPATLIPQAKKGMPSYDKGLLRFSGTNCRKSQPGLVTLAKNSWQLKILNNCLSTRSSLWKEWQREIQRASPSLDRLAISRRYGLMCVLVTYSHKQRAYWILSFGEHCNQPCFNPSRTRLRKEISRAWHDCHQFSEQTDHL